MANFSLAKIAKVASFPETTFAGGATFSRVDVGGPLTFLSAKFLDEQHAADFTGVKIGGDATFSKVVFHGGCDFSGGNLAETVRFDAAVFGKQARFVGMAIAGRGIFNQAIFRKGADFSIVNVTGWLLVNFAVFEGEANFSLSRFGNVVEFTGTIFKSAVAFNSAIVAGSLIFSPGIIKDEDPRPVEFADTASFRSCKVAADVNFSKVRFQGKALFSQAEVVGDANFVATHFKGDADFRSVIVRRDAYFNAAAFAAQATFRFADFGGDANFTRAEFGDGTDFTGVRLKGTGYFSGSEFRGPARFRNTAVEGDLRFEAIADKSPARSVPVAFKASVDGDGLEVKRELVFADCTFAPDAELTLRGAAIGILSCNNSKFGAVDCFSAQFNGALIFSRNVVDGKANFSVVKVNGRALFNGTIFKKTCDLREASLGGLTTFNAGASSDGGLPETPCTFESVVSFDKVRFGGAAEFRGTIFRDRVTFSATLFADELTFTHAGATEGGPAPEKLLFSGKTEFVHAVFLAEVNFVAVLFKNAATFSKTRFQSRVTFSNVDFSDPSDNSAVFSEAEFQSQAAFLNCTVAGRLAFYGAKSHHTLGLDTSCQFKGVIDFRNAQLSILRIATIIGERPPDFSFLGRLDLGGCTYRRITCDELGVDALWDVFRNSLEPRDWTRSGSARFERQPYFQFEQFCREAGANELADTVYFDLRRAEGKLERRRLFWFWNWTERLVFGYGVRPLRMVVVFLLLLLGGALVIGLPPSLGAAWDYAVQGFTISFTNLVPGVDKLIKNSRAPGTVGPFETAVAVAQYCLGWALLALLAHRFFKGLKR